MINSLVFGVFGTSLLLTAYGRSTLMDLTHTLVNGSIHGPLHQPYEIYTDRAGPFKSIDWLKNDHFITGTHLGTHMDAPIHRSKTGLAIEEIPIEQFVAPAVFIDIRGKASKDPDAHITVDDVLDFEKKHGQIPTGSVVFQCSGWSDYFFNETMMYGTDDGNRSNFHFPAFGEDAVKWLWENRKIVGIAVDTPSVDYGQSPMPKMVHAFFSSKNMYALEFVKDTCKAPPIGTTAYIFPSKLGGASGASSRVIIQIPGESDIGSSFRSSTSIIMAAIIFLSFIKP